MPKFMLRLLGPAELRNASGVRVDEVMAQPKRLLLLAHLAACSREGCARRDSLAALFWPDADQAHARHDLRQALYFLRRHLHPEVILTPSDEEVGVNGRLLGCDVVELEDALARERLHEVQALYRGDLLEAFHVPDVSADLEQRLDARRARLRERVAEAAWQLADQAAEREDPSEVLHWGRRALELSRGVESAYRQLMELLDRVGDPAAAILLHRELVERLAEDFGIGPSAATTVLLERIRRPE